MINSWQITRYIDLGNTSSKGENDCCKQNQNISDLKQKQEAIDNPIKIRKTYKNNPIIGNLSINSPYNKIMNLREIIDKALVNNASIK